MFARNYRIHRIGMVVVLLLASLASAALPDKEALLNEPYVEWTLVHEGYNGNPYDVNAHAVFTHAKSGEQDRVLVLDDAAKKYPAPDTRK